jgi:hypothetical protein
MPAFPDYALTLDGPRRRSSLPRMRWTRELPHHVAIRWTR